MHTILATLAMFGVNAHSFRRLIRELIDFWMLLPTAAALVEVSMASGGLLIEIDDELKSKHGIVLLRSK